MKIEFVGGNKFICWSSQILDELDFVLIVRKVSVQRR